MADWLICLKFACKALEKSPEKGTVPIEPEETKHFDGGGNRGGLPSAGPKNGECGKLINFITLSISH